MSATNTLHCPDLRQIPVCPVCHHNDQVKTAQEAYKGGVARLVPPPLPRRAKVMMPWIVTGMVIYLARNFYLLAKEGLRSLWKCLENRCVFAVRIHHPGAITVISCKGDKQ